MSTAVQETAKLISHMSRAEKAQVLQWIVQDLGDTFPGIETNPGVAGGAACIVRTRIPVWLLEQARTAGATDAALLQAYPSLNAEDLANAWAYVRMHSDEIAQHTAENNV
jgi:uncharacterized protein (DUF433 family)